MKLSLKDFFSKCDQIRSFLRIWSHLLKKPFTENLIFCAVNAKFDFLHAAITVIAKLFQVSQNLINSSCMEHSTEKCCMCSYQ